MSKHEKLLTRLLSRPTDFTWKETVTLMSKYGYVALMGSGSRRKFHHTETGQVVTIHQPHAGDPLLPYAVRDIITGLKEGGHINE